MHDDGRGLGCEAQGPSQTFSHALQHHALTLVVRHAWRCGKVIHKNTDWIQVHPSSSTTSQLQILNPHGE